MKLRALDLFCGAGGVSVGLEQAGFQVTAVDINPQPYHRGGEFIKADAMEFLRDRALLRTFDFIHASPPCQGYSALRHLTKGKEYPKLIETVRFLLERSDVPWSIENVPGAPLRGNVTVLCGTMFGLQTPGGRAELRRHRLFETSWPIALRPPCQHGHVGIESISVTGTGMGVGGKARWAERKVLTVVGHTPTDNTGRGKRVICVAGGKAMAGGMMTPQGELKRRAISVTGNTPQTNTVRNSVRTTFTTADARAAMGIGWMPMKDLSQAIPPAYSEFIGREAIDFIMSRRSKTS